jgi:NADPH:quinone reductase-like Zn-dependent oxidoreductase
MNSDEAFVDAALSRYAAYHEVGPARAVIELLRRPVPHPGPGQVLVEVHRSGINPSDTKRRSGWASYKPHTPPVVLHTDGAGIIVQVGEGVSASRIGERVWLWNAETDGQGTASDHCLVQADHAVPLPENASFDAGACLGVPACTAHRAVFADGSVDRQTVLVQGGAGAVGSYAIQFARPGGARVIATGSTPEKRQVATDLGAHRVVDYRDPDAARLILDANDGRGVDRIIEVDLGDNLPLDLAVAGTNATIASYSSTRVREFTFPYYQIAPKGLNFLIVQGYCLAQGAREEGIVAITQAFAEGWLRHRIGAVFPFEQIVEAHEAAERGETDGKVLVALR